MDVIPTEKLLSTACATINDKEMDSLIPLNSTMGDEIRRLETFKRWPKSHIVKPQSLAQAGFYYTNRDDYVQCAYCLGSIYNWMLGDNAMEEHRRLFPNCGFVKRVGNRYKCIKCLHAEVDVVFIPCLHITCCSKCAVTMTNCLMCREGIKSNLKVRFCHDKETFPSCAEQCDGV